jgi:hypothetical protein
LTRAALDHDPFDRLADALMEDIAAASGDDLLGEVEEDFGDAGVLAVAFDEVLAGAEALVLRQSAEDAIGNLAIDNLADALCDDIAATPPEALLREAAEDHGDARALAAAFDRALSGGDAPSVAMERAGAGTLSGARERGRAVVSPAAAGRSPASLRAACATALHWLTVPLRSRTAIAAFTALLLVVVLAPGLVERYAERIAATSEYAAPGPPMARPVASVTSVQGRPSAERTPAGYEPPAPSQLPDVKQDAAAPPSGSGAGEQLAAAPPLAAPPETAEQQNRRDALTLRGRGQEAPQQELAATEGLRTLELRRLTEADQKRRAAGEAGQPPPPALDQQRKAEQERQGSERQETERQAALEPKPKAPPEPQPAERPASGPPARQAARPVPAPMAAQPAPAPPRVIANLPEQIRQAQAELRRLGCLKGPSDGRLNDETRKAVRAFLALAAGSTVEAAITDELIAGMRLQPDGVCRGDAPAVAIRLPAPPARR